MVTALLTLDLLLELMDIRMHDFPVGGNQLEKHLQMTKPLLKNEIEWVQKNIQVSYQFVNMFLFNSRLGFL